MFAVTLSKEEMATAVAGMQFWALGAERYAAMTEGAIAEANYAEARRIRKVAADLADRWFETEFKQRMSAMESVK